MSNVSAILEMTDESLLEDFQIVLDETVPTVEDLINDAKHLERYVSPSAIEFYATVRRGEIPESIPFEISEMYAEDYGSSSFSAYSVHAYQQKCGYYAKFTQYFAREIAEQVGDGVVLDPMAGRGYAVKALRNAGVKTIASDNNSWSISDHIENLDALDSLRKYGDKISHLLISWAPFENDIDLKLLREVRANFPHVTIINVGEKSGGCTGSTEFWDEAVIVEHSLAYENLYGLFDRAVYVK